MNAQDDEDLDDQAFFNVRFYKLVYNNNEDAFEGMVLEENLVIHLSSIQPGIDPLLSTSQFDKFTYSSEYNQLLLISSQGIWSYNLDVQVQESQTLGTSGDFFDYVSKFLGFRHLIKSFKWIGR